MRDRDPDHRRPDKPNRRDDRKPFGGKQFGSRQFGAKRLGKPKAAPWRGAPRDRDGPVVLYGWPTVKAALENPQRHFHRLLATENAARRLADDGAPLPIEPPLVRPDDIAAVPRAASARHGPSPHTDPPR